MITLKPRQVDKAKDKILKAHANDFSDLLNFDDPSMPFRERIMLLQAKLESFPQMEIPIRHQFCDGLYARTVWVPGNIMTVTRIYKVDHVVVISEGEVSIRSEFGGGRAKAPHIFTAKAGSKRAIFHHTDVVWTTVLPSTSSDIGENEDRVYASSYEEFDALFPLAEVG